MMSSPVQVKGTH